MGADIHVVLEVLIEGKYVGISEIDLDRCYDMFSMMAGVRGYHESGFSARGLPDNASDMSIRLFGDSEGDYSCFHSHSRLNMEEFVFALNECRKTNIDDLDITEYILPKDYAVLATTMLFLSYNQIWSRIVFCFDS